MLETQVTEFLSDRFGVPPGDFELSLQTVHGGLESQVVRATIARTPNGSRRLPRRFLVKELRGWQRREADIYRLVNARLEGAPTVRIIGEYLTADAAYLFMEEARGRHAWPWTDVALGSEVCAELARLHDAGCVPPADWNYERELRDSAAETYDVALRAQDPDGIRCWRRPGELRRVVEGLPDVRARLLSHGATFIHGDVHPGNVIVSDNGTGRRIVLLDWGRARPGSPLEDVAGWLHSLGCWEPEARRRHDTLLRAYLRARRLPPVLDARLRGDYWLAAASNGLSGAIRYHLMVLGDAFGTPRRRRESARALREWERVIRRARSEIRTSPTSRS